jgi:CRP-like cAMP-binding protein
LDAQPREASVITQQKSVVMRIPEFLIKGVAQESQVVRELEHFMTAIMIDQFFASAPMFRKLPREGIEFLSSKGVLQYTGAGETVFSQGDPGDSFYMVIRGTVQVVLEGEMVKTISQGGFFGEIALIGNIPRTATIRAGEPTVLFKITSQAFWEVLVRYIEMAMFVESIGERRLYEDLQVMSKRRSAS